MISEINQQLYPINSSLKTVHKYFRLFWRWKWYTGLLFPLLSAIWLFYVFFVSQRLPDLTGTILLGVENSSAGVLGIPNVTVGLGKVELMKSSNFLGDIVDSVSLRLTLKNNVRGSIFKSIIVDTSAIDGIYNFELKGISSLTYSIQITNNKLGIRKHVIKTGEFPCSTAIKIPGMVFEFNDLFKEKPFNFEYHIIPKQKVIENLKKSLVIKSNIKRDPLLEGVVPVELNGKDPELIALILNSMGNLFLERNISFRKNKKEELLNRLEIQLNAAKERLDRTQKQLLTFRKANPETSLEDNLQKTVSELSVLDNEKIEVRRLIDQSSDIMNRLLSAGNNEVETNVNEALYFLKEEGIPAAIALLAEESFCIQQQHFLNENKYSIDHPLRIKNNDYSKRIYEKTIIALDAYKKTKVSEDKIITENVKKLNLKLQRIPSQQLRLVELQRQLDITGQIYSTIMSNFTQVKISENTSLGDIFVLDYAAPPEPSSGFNSLVKLLMMGLIPCLLISFGPPLISEYFWKKAYFEDDLRILTPYPVLGSIPMFKDGVNKNSFNYKSTSSGSIAINKEIHHPYLVSNSNSSCAKYRLYNFICTKIKYHLNEVSGKSILITSINESDGKSLSASNVAITLAYNGKKTLLFDCNHKQSTLSTMFGLQNKIGLSEIVTSDILFNENTILDSIQSSHIPNLYLLSQGEHEGNLTRLLCNNRFDQIYKKLSNIFEIIVFDAPSLTTEADSIELSDYVDGIIIIVRAKKTDITNLVSVINEYPVLNRKMIGTVLNGSFITRNKKTIKQTISQI